MADLLDQIHRTGFLGAEFLTWLWYRCDTGHNEFQAPELGPFEVWFDDRLVVSSLALDAQENHFRGGHPTTSPEARVALRLGKKASEAQLRIHRAGQEWSFLLKAEGLAVSRVHSPAVLSREEDNKLYERMLLLEQLDEMLKAVFALFVRLRLSTTWAKETLPALRRWAAS